MALVALRKREPKGKPGHVIVNTFDVSAIVDGDREGAQIYLRGRETVLGAEESALVVKAIIDRALEHDLLTAIDAARTELGGLANMSEPVVKALAILNAALSSRRSGHGTLEPARRTG